MKTDASPVLVYQMGKVGSTSVDVSLRALNLPYPVFHAHFLSSEGIKNAEKYILERNGNKNKAHLMLSRKLRCLMDRVGNGIRWKVITLVRDPISREISDLWTNMNLVLPETRHMSANRALKHICRHLRTRFEHFDETRDYATNWFDMEIKSVFDIDLYAQPFDIKAGYSIYKAPMADILVARFENMNRCMNAAMAEFLGLKNFRPIRSNANKKMLYTEVTSTLRLHPDVLDKIYDARLASHFYSEGERQTFKKKWSPLDHSIAVNASPHETLRVMIIHPEGNVNNNPNLTGITQILCERGFEIDYYALKNHFSQIPPCDGVQMCLNDPDGRTALDGFVAIDREVLQSGEKIRGYIRDQLPEYDLVIGVDRGIIEANLIALTLKVPCGLISYEIMFLRETTAAFKQVEISSCRHLAFAVCQDAVRAKHLKIENHLKSEIINIPMGARKAHLPGKSSYLHETLNIPNDKKIALVIGSLDRWTMTDYIIYCLQKWPEDWALVLHNRYGIDKCTKYFLSNCGHMKNLYFSTKPEQTHATMKRVVQSADIGLALYRPIPDNLYLGNNIRHIGMSSGKIATYLQYGLPVVVNEIGEMSDYVSRYELGTVVDTSSIFIPDFTADQLTSMRGNCHLFYTQHLDLNHTITPLIKRIETITACWKPVATQREIITTKEFLG